MIGNSVFPCLFEKLLAKIYGNYDAIPENLVNILEVLSCYSKQVISFFENSEK